MRLFFSKEIETNGKVSRRYNYGMVGCPTSDLRVCPFDEDLEEIVKSLQQQLEKNPKVDTGEKGVLFNHLECQIYHGEDIFKELYYGDDQTFRYGKTEPKLINDKGNKEDRIHCDSSFDDNGKQLDSDALKGDHLTAMLTVGGTRELSLVPSLKCGEGGNWEDQPGLGVVFELERGSIFILNPKDECPLPQKFGHKAVLQKFRHKARFWNAGVSVALIFRAVKDNAVSNFATETNLCHWKTDPVLKPKLRAWAGKRRDSKRQKLLHPPLTATSATLRKMQQRSREYVKAGMGWRKYGTTTTSTKTKASDFRDGIKCS